MKLSAIIFAIACILAIFASGVSADPKRSNKREKKKGGIAGKIGRAIGGTVKDIVVDTASEVLVGQINNAIDGEQAPETA